MEKITRTLTVTTVQYAEAIVENGVPTFRPCGDEMIPGEIADQVKALQYLRKKYGVDRSFVVTGMTTATKKYEMDLATFVATATPVEPATKPEAPASGETVSDAPPAGMNGETATPGTAPAPDGMVPTDAPPPAGPAGTYPGSSAVPPAEAAPFGAPPAGPANPAQYNGPYPGFSAPQ